jgi:hypothetical protein
VKKLNIVEVAEDECCVGGDTAAAPLIHVLFSKEILSKRIRNIMNQISKRLQYCTAILNVGFSSKLTCKGTWRQVFIFLRPPPLLAFCLEWKNNFVGLESGQIHSVSVDALHTTFSPPPL